MELGVKDKGTCYKPEILFFWINKGIIYGECL